MARLRRRATIARKAIIQILETAQEYGFDGEEWQTLARETRTLTRALRGVERLDEMESRGDEPGTPAEAARERLEDLLGTVEIRPQGAGKPAPHIQLQTKP